jgi:hypothetical protein
MKISFAQFMSLGLVVVKVFQIKNQVCFVVKRPDVFTMQTAI